MYVFEKTYCGYLLIIESPQLLLSSVGQDSLQPQIFNYFFCIVEPRLTSLRFITGFFEYFFF